MNTAPAETRKPLPARPQVPFRSLDRYPRPTPPFISHPRLRRLGSLLTLPLLLVGLALTPRAAAQVSGSIAVYPTDSRIEAGASRQFNVYVPISPNSVVWSVNDIVGGTATFGTISASGYYRAPDVPPAANVVYIRARSTAFPAAVGTARLTITRPYPWLWSVSPASLAPGPFQVSLNGANFAADSQVLVNDVPVATSFVSATALVARGTVAQAGTLRFAVRQPGNGAVTGNGIAVTVITQAVTVAVAPVSAAVAVGTTRAFTSSVTGSTNAAVTWSVNGIAGGSATLGTITAGGVYTAPATLPVTSTLTVRATSVASPTAFAQATVTLTPPPLTVVVSPATATVQVGRTQTFAATVTGTANTAVIWSVNGVDGGSGTVGTISAAGTYTAPAAVPVPATVTIRAAAVANPAATAQAVVTLSSAPPPTVSLAAARFLEQSSFGPTRASLAAVQQRGIPAYLQEQFALPETVIPMPTNNSMGGLRNWMLANYTGAPDQLRQRVAYSLGQILVTSANKLIYPDAMLPWLQLLSRHAFGNYRTLLRDLTVCPSMGKYLDLAYSTRPGPGGSANENYPRELLQLFTIGLWQLNPDGSLLLDWNGLPIPTYDQRTVQQVALALTGWVYATPPGGSGWEYFGAPMVPAPARHDPSAKAFLGTTLPAGQTVEQDLDGVIDCLMRHPNTAPFIATRLIRSLVTSNPSAAYIRRVADVFTNNGSGVAGDLKAVIAAILLDPEARQDTPAADQGRLKEPILHIAGLVRALNGRFSTTQQLTYLFDSLGQSVLNPPSVFNWFSPLYRVPKSPLFGPEFQIYSPTEATLRGNFIYALLHSPNNPDTGISLAPFLPYGNDLPNLVEAANQVLLYGRMPAAMKQVLINAAAPGYDAATRIETVLYLTALSGQYAIQH